MRKEQNVTPAFSKDKSFEDCLSLMNHALSGVELSMYRDLEELYPTVHVLGAPRSGTTLLTQLISSTLEVGYINNLIATFWKAPLFGIQLSKKLLGLKYRSDFSSQFGRTSSIYEPHEFGYFWNEVLRYDDFAQKTAGHEDSIDWEKLKMIFLNMCAAFERPVLFKSFLMGFHAATFQKVLPKTCFILVTRDTLENAHSLLKMRERMFGNIESWASIRPVQYEWLSKLDIYQQVVGQVLSLEHEYRKQLRGIPKSNILEVRLDEVCMRPLDFVADVKKLLKNQGAEVNIVSDFASVPRNIPDFSPERIDNDPETMERLETALSEMKKKSEIYDQIVESR